MDFVFSVAVEMTGSPVSGLNPGQAFCHLLVVTAEEKALMRNNLRHVVAFASRRLVLISTVLVVVMFLLNVCERSDLTGGTCSNVASSRAGQSGKVDVNERVNKRSSQVFNIFPLWPEKLRMIQIDVCKSS